MLAPGRPRRHLCAAVRRGTVAADVTVGESETGATEAPTQVLPGGFARRDDAPSVLDAGVLAGEERRTRMGALRALFVALVLFSGAIALMPGKTALTWALIALYTAVAAVIGALMLLSRRHPYGDGVSTVIGVVLVILVLGSCLYFGVVGGPAIILPPLVYYYGLGNSAPRRRWVAATAVGGEILLTLLAAVGLVPPTGMIPVAALLDRGHILSAGVAVTVLLGATYWLSSRSRRSTLLAMAELERARRGIRQRDALLAEAHEDLDRVVGGARAGRLTGRDVDGFEIGSVVGRGAMGEVYQATARDSGQTVAFKVLHPHLAESEGQVARFFREAEITAVLDSPHIPRLFASGTDEDGAPYLVLELLHGLDLATDLRQRQSLPLDEIDALVAQVCGALHAAHEAGVVHRDIKPQNLFLAIEPHVAWKVLDFGVSMMASGSGTLTQGAAVGTPAYMAPEQALGMSVDRRADVFSLGAVVYRALTGRPAFRGPSAPATLHAVMHAQPVRPGELSRVPSDVDAVIALALAKKRGKRLGSARAFADAWKAARREQLDTGLRAAAQRLVAAHAWGTEDDA